MTEFFMYFYLRSGLLEFVSAIAQLKDNTQKTRAHNTNRSK